MSKPWARIRVAALAIACHGWLLLASAPGSAAAEGQADGRDGQAAARGHDDAVALARRGRLTEALALLAVLARQYPADLGIARDRIVISTWARQDAVAVQLFEALPRGDNPDYVVEAVAHAYRNLGRYDRAVELYRDGITRYRTNIALAAGEIETLADSGDARGALDLAEKMLTERGDAPALLTAAAYAANVAGEPVEALRYLDRLLARDPGNRGARRQRILAIESMGAPELALGLARAEPGLLSPEEMQRLEGSVAAQLVRWGTIAPASEADRFATTDRAIALLDDLIARWSSDSGANRDMLLRARADRLIAYYDRNRMADVVDEYESMLHAGIAVPAYVLPDVAGAYLARRQPETARDLYRKFLENDPKNMAAQLGLVHALIDSEDFDQARQIVDEVAASLSPWITLKGAPEPIPNPDKLDADIAAANTRLYANDLPEAELRFTAMSDLAPYNAGLLVALASVYAERGWPRRAAEVLERARAQQPRDASIAIAQARVDADLQDWQAYRQAVDDLRRRLPESPDVERLVNEEKRHDRGELRLFAGRALRSSTSLNGGSGLSMGAQVYSPPVADDWRIFAGYRLAHERLPEGNLTERVYEAGLEYRARDLTAMAEARAASYGTLRGGGTLEASWSIDDHWKLGGRGEVFATDTPLRALRNGITANAINGKIGYRESESRAIDATAQGMFFSDGNDRTSLGAQWRERVVTTPHLRLDALVNLAASGNTRRDAPYFNPRRDLLGTGGGELTHILYRRYEFVYEHGLAASVGPYWEQNFGTSLAWNVRYEQRIRDNVCEAGIAVGFARQPYDGAYENALTIDVTMTLRF